jgi:DNA polymerase-3 subunit delta
MIHIFHGEDEFGKSEAIAALRQGVSADPSLIDLNLTLLDGRTVTATEIIHHCDVPPFLGEYRLVILSDLLARLAGSKTKEGEATGSSEEMMAWLLAYLPTTPETTHLVLNEAKTLPARHPILALAVGHKQRMEIRAFAAPGLKGGELARWVENRARQKGARLEPGVANDLATFIGPNLRLIDTELEKLSLHAGGGAISQADVRLLVPYAQQASIFDMVDALGHRQTQQAFRLLSQMHNQGAHYLYLLTMIVRQYRILLQVKELADQGMGQDAIARQIGLHSFPTGKAMAQAQRYTPQQLARIYDRLLDTDVAIKTGKMDGLLALNLLVVELARL